MKYIIFLLLLPFWNFAQDSLVLNFQINSDKLSNSDMLKLKKFIAKDVLLVDRIIGYTDSIGTETHNKDLSVRRANHVKSIIDMVNNNLTNNTIVEGKGELPTLGRADRKVIIVYRISLQAKLKSAKVGDKITMNNLNFQPGLDVLLPESVPQLAELLRIMRENSKLMISIQGHICCSLTDEVDLSTNRAKAVYNYLTNNGIAPDRLSYKGFGSTQPKYPLPEKNEFEQIANRRVELRIVAKEE